MYIIEACKSLSLSRALRSFVKLRRAVDLDQPCLCLLEPDRASQRKSMRAEATLHVYVVRSMCFGPGVGPRSPTKCDRRECRAMWTWLQWLEDQVWALVNMLLWACPASSSSRVRRPLCKRVFAPAPRGEELGTYPEIEVGFCSCDSCIEALNISIDSRRTYWRRPSQLAWDVPHHHPGWRYQPGLGWLFNTLNYSADEPDSDADHVQAAAEPQVQDAMPAQEPAQEYTVWNSADVILRPSLSRFQTLDCMSVSDF